MGREILPNCSRLRAFHMSNPSNTTKPVIITIHADSKLRSKREPKSRNAAAQRTPRHTRLAKEARLQANGSKNAAKMPTLFVLPIVLNVFTPENSNGRNAIPFICAKAYKTATVPETTNPESRYESCFVSFTACERRMANRKNPKRERKLSVTSSGQPQKLPYCQSENIVEIPAAKSTPAPARRSQLF